MCSPCSDAVLCVFPSEKVKALLQIARICLSPRLSLLKRVYSKKKEFATCGLSVGQILSFWSRLFRRG